MTEEKNNEQEKADAKPEIEEMKDIDVDREAEKICRWAAARASVIVVTPVLGTMALMANEVYMITRLADLRGVKLEEGAIAGLLGSLGASFVGQTIFTLIPFAPVQIPIAVSVTYGVGKVANAWLKADRPDDVAQFREVFEDARDEGMSKFKEFSNSDEKDKPLGDESKKFKFQAEPIYNQVKEHADKVADKVESSLGEFMTWLQPLKEKGTRWLSAQKWDDISHGGLTVPYVEVKNKLAQSLEGSEFTLQDLCYHDPLQVELVVQHVKHGTIKLIISPEEFTINNTKAFVRLRINDFEVLDNDFAQLIVETLGTKLIMAIVNAIFSESVIEKADFACIYNDNVLEVNFTQLIQNSKIVQFSFMEKNVLDVVQFVALVPMGAGLLVKSSLRK